MRRKIAPNAPRRMFADFPSGKCIDSRAVKENRSGCSRNRKLHSRKETRAENLPIAPGVQRCAGEATDKLVEHSL